MDFLTFAALVAAGFLAGFINTLAGSGSLITLPMLIFIGLPANLANGTNRVAILLQNVVGTQSFYKREKLDIKGVIYLGLPAVFGSILGAGIAVNMNEELMRNVIGIVMVVMLFVILVRPKRWLEGVQTNIEGIPNWKVLGLFFLIGIYGGFIQAGVGIFLLAGMVLGVGYDLVRANAVKVGIVLFYTVFALGVFVVNKQVDWVFGFVLGIGNMSGAWVAAHFAVEKGTVWVRRILILVVLASALQLLGIIELIINWLQL